jgi:SPP1 gp7 family putative phage head morphogenesis protein
MTETAMRDSLKQAGFTVKFRPTREAREAFRAVLSENVGLIKSIQQQYLTGVQTRVWQSVGRGADMATLSRKLQDEYGSTTKRAALIARDQNAKAKATIENTRRAELGIRQAIWQHSAGGREPRPSHVDMHGKVFDLAKGMYDPEEKEFILPGTLINCRCTSRAILPGLDDDAA